MQLDANGVASLTLTKKVNILLGVVHIQPVDRKTTGQKFVTTKKRTRKDAR